VETQRVTRGLFDHERHRAVGHRPQPLFAGQGVDRGHGRGELAVPLGEHGVIDGVLGVEVLVQGRGAHADPRREIPQVQPAQALFAH
jgi:hypothetical protein